MSLEDDLNFVRTLLDKNGLQNDDPYSTRAGKPKLLREKLGKIFRIIVKLESLTECTDETVFIKNMQETLLSLNSEIQEFKKLKSNKVTSRWLLKKRRKKKAQERKAFLRDWRKAMRTIVEQELEKRYSNQMIEQKMALRKSAYDSKLQHERKLLKKLKRKASDIEVKINVLKSIRGDASNFSNPYKEDFCALEKTSNPKKVNKTSRTFKKLVNVRRSWDKYISNSPSARPLLEDF